MKLTTAIRQLQKESAFLGVNFTTLIVDLEKAPLSFPNRTIEAYKVYKQEYSRLERFYA